jgi:hypothetical protein
MAQDEGLVGGPDVLSGGPRERFSSQRRSQFRVVALGVIVIALAAFGGYRLGTTLERSRQAAAPRDVGEGIAITGGRPAGEGFGAGSIWVPIWSLNHGEGNGSVAR